MDDWLPPLVVLIWGILIFEPAGFLMGSAVGWLIANQEEHEKRWATTVRYAGLFSAAVAACIALYCAAWFLFSTALHLTEGMI